jgi:phosphotriesterase-related protein
MEITTVKGAISPETLGITLPHEHLICDSSAFRTPSHGPVQRKLSLEALNISNLGIARKNPMLVGDNWILDDVQLVEKELMLYKRMGGRSIVEMTNIGLGRDVLALRAISEATDVHIIAGCGYYLEESLPAAVRNSSIEDLALGIISEIKHGVDSTGICPGIIGEIGTGHPKLSESDVKMLKVAARAQLETGLAINIHNVFSREHGKMLDVLEEESVDLHRVVLSHVDASQSILVDVDYQESILSRGAYVEYDQFGFGTYYDGSDWPEEAVSPLWDGQFPRDVDKIKALKTLIQRGFLKQVLISMDTWCKMNLKTYGGYGYDYILSTIVRLAKKYGIKDKEIQAILVENPRAMLSH